MIEGLDDWEIQEASKRVAYWNATDAARKAKSVAEQTRIDAGIGVETPEDAVRYADDDDD